MTYETDAAKRYRDHAGQLRGIAETEWLEETRRALMRVALDYDQMAETMESIARTNLASGKR